MSPQDYRNHAASKRHAEEKVKQIRCPYAAKLKEMGLDV